MFPDLPDAPCYLNGVFTPVREAKVSVLDRGFIFGDGVYEVLPAYGGRIFRFDQHMDRLDRSLAEVRIRQPLSRQGWLEIARRLMRDLSTGQGVADQLVYIQVTRGVARRDHAMPEGMEPTVFVTTSALKPASADQRIRGVWCVTAADFRWQKAHIKSTSLLGSVLARQISADAGAIETVMFRDDWLSEGASSNVWVVRDGEVFGPPKDHLVLQGIRYDLMDELCATCGIRFHLRRIPRAEVLHADELLLSSASKEVLPVTRLDESPVGAGQPGPIYRQLYAAYQDAKSRHLT